MALRKVWSHGIPPLRGRGKTSDAPGQLPASTRHKIWLRTAQFQSEILVFTAWQQRGNGAGFVI